MIALEWWVGEFSSQTEFEGVSKGCYEGLQMKWELMYIHIKRLQSSTFYAINLFEMKTILCLSLSLISCNQWSRINFICYLEIWYIYVQKQKVNHLTFSLHGLGLAWLFLKIWIYDHLMKKLSCLATKY